MCNTNFLHILWLRQTTTNKKALISPWKIFPYWLTLQKTREPENTKRHGLIHMSIPPLQYGSDASKCNRNRDEGSGRDVLADCRCLILPISIWAWTVKTEGGFMEDTLLKSSIGNTAHQSSPWGRYIKASSFASSFLTLWNKSQSFKPAGFLNNWIPIDFEKEIISTVLLLLFCWNVFGSPTSKIKLYERWDSKYGTNDYYDFIPWGTLNFLKNVYISKIKARNWVHE